jgi:hypothetical protein
VDEQQDVAYDERLTAPPWVWAAVLSVARVSAAALHGGAPGWRSVVPYAVLLPVAVGGLLWRRAAGSASPTACCTCPARGSRSTTSAGVTPLTREGTRACADRSPSRGPTS